MTTITESNISQQLDLSSFELVLPPGLERIVEYPNRAAFPLAGKTQRLYIDLSTGLPWRWSAEASDYALLIPMIDCGEF